MKLPISWEILTSREFQRGYSQPGLSGFVGLAHCYFIAGTGSLLYILRDRTGRILRDLMELEDLDKVMKIGGMQAIGGMENLKELIERTPHGE